MADEFEEPGYSIDQSTKEGFVRLRVKIDRLKCESIGFFARLRGLHPLPKGRNAEILNPTITERGFELIVKGTPEGEMKGAKYKLTFKQLPYDVDPKECYLVGLEGFIEVFLKKVDENQDWDKYVRSGTLETFEG
ncbi:hypothetical protein PoB_002063200 [Plakobranchus ocellatus]|uniref:Uncharacterized protein n=1 Tax=Plakobranchus ocellatus TaxID=259542 RepID=A0AAV3ZFN8_9GAST|nr:hypothetical protein PoB_002063200 [Plakobranchus ocellatus]